MNAALLSALDEVTISEPERLWAESIAFFDLETTGIGSTDRLVSLAAVKLRLTAPGEITVLHLVFNPECECSRAAALQHGYTARELSRQDRFDAYARPLRQWFEDVDLIVANAVFDIRALRAAFARAGLPELTTPSECAAPSGAPRRPEATRWEAIAAAFGLVRGVRHGALRDAWACMQAFLRIHGLPWRLDYALCGDPAPANYRAPTPQLQRFRAACGFEV